MLSFVETYDNFISFTGKVDLHYPNDYHGRHMFILDQAPVPQTDINLKWLFIKLENAIVCQTMHSFILPKILV